MVRAGLSCVVNTGTQKSPLQNESQWSHHGVQRQFERLIHMNPASRGASRSSSAESLKRSQDGERWIDLLRVLSQEMGFYQPKLHDLFTVPRSRDTKTDIRPWEEKRWGKNTHSPVRNFVMVEYTTRCSNSIVLQGTSEDSVIPLDAPFPSGTSAF